MRLYIFRDIYTGKLYKVHEWNAMYAKDKVAKLMNIPFYNLARVKPQERKEYA
jgi:hypothetical protein